MEKLRMAFFPFGLLGIIFIFLCILSFASRCKSVERQIIVGKTGDEIQIEEGSASSLLALSEEEYNKIAAMLVDQPNYIVLSKKLETSEEIMYGYNFPIGLNHRVGFAFMGNDNLGYKLIPDLDGDGDLTNDSVYDFEQKNGRYVFEFDESVPSLEKTDVSPITLKFLLAISSMKRPGITGPQTNILLYNESIRYGKLRVSDKEITFALRGKGGVYGLPHQEVFFDMDGDEEFDLAKIRSPERYLVSEKYVNLSGWSYEIEVDPKGGSLKLIPLLDRREPRMELMSGYSAPDFDFKDMNDKEHRFSDYRGKIILLEFWGSWCAPCWEGAPYLVKAYTDYHDLGFDVVGVHWGDQLEKIQEFLSKFEIGWIQTLETDSSNPIHDLYRIDRWPTYFLIGRDGIIISDELQAEHLEQELKKIFDQNH